MIDGLSRNVHGGPRSFFALDHVFVYDPRKPVRSSLEELLPGARWRSLPGPGGAEAMWDLRGRHLVHGRQPDSGVRPDPAVARRLLDSRLLLAGDSASLAQLARGVRVVELWAGRGRVSEAVAELGGRAVRLGYRWGQDFARAVDRAAIDRLVQRARPGTVLCAPMCGPWSSYSDLNAALHVGFARTLRLRRIRQVVILRWMCDLLLRQLLRGGNIVLEQPRSSRMWRVFCLLRLIRLARLRGYDLDFVDLDQCAFRLEDPLSGRLFKKATRLLVSGPRRYSALKRRCRCRLPHQQLSGSTRSRGCSRRRTCFAECYPPLVDNDLPLPARCAGVHRNPLWHGGSVSLGMSVGANELGVYYSREEATLGVSLWLSLE